MTPLGMDGRQSLNCIDQEKETVSFSPPPITFSCVALVLFVYTTIVYETKQGQNWDGSVTGDILKVASMVGTMFSYAIMR